MTLDNLITLITAGFTKDEILTMSGTATQRAPQPQRLSHVRLSRTLPQICPSTTDTHRHTCPLYAHNGQNISAIYTSIN